MQTEDLSACKQLWVQPTIEARIGRNRVVVAVLLEHSVNVAISRQRISEMAKGGIFCSGVKLCPNHSDRPETCKHTNNQKVLFFKRS